MAASEWNNYPLPPLETKILLKPWWKEKLKRKYFVPSNLQDSRMHHLNIKSWMFLRGRLDDVGNGIPVLLDDNTLAKDLRCNKELHVSQSSLQQNQSDERPICLSKKTPLQQLRLKDVDQIESELKRHQLAIFPHLEECLPPELYEDVVELLNPEIYSALAEKYADDAKIASANSQQISGIEQSSSLNNVKTVELSNKVDEEINDDLYRWITLLNINEKEVKDKKRTPEFRKNASQSEDENIHKITTDFCKWVSSLGGDSNNIEESTLTSLFASGYETKPALSVPIHIVELTSVPPELRISENTQSQHVNLPTKPQEQNVKVQVEEIPSRNFVKFKYGAWYLNRRLWKVRAADEPLCDPNDAKDKEMSDAKKKSLAMDYDLALLHGTRLFKDFVDRKDSRKPEFLQHIATIHAEQKLEERETRAQAENPKKRQMLSTKYKSVEK